MAASERSALHIVPPPLSSSSSVSTRSSAYTASHVHIDYGPVHVASPDDDTHGLIVPPDSLAKMLATDPAQFASARNSPRAHEPARWSEYSLRSRASSFANGLSAQPPPLPTHDYPASPHLSQKASYDATCARDDHIMSEDETDDEPVLDHLDQDDQDLDDDDERTSAAVLADEGTGLIVHGDNIPISQLHIPTATTHLLIGSSSTPNAVPAFLTNMLPRIAHSLLALDISNNFLGALPPVLAVCENLEELNVASNPLRVLPVFLADLANLRVLIADSTGISTLPDVLADLDKLHTISIRRNKFHALPSWFCLLPALQTLCVDNNPFQGPWKALVDPLLAKAPLTPFYPPSTPMLPSSASLQCGEGETDATEDIDDFSDQEGPYSNQYSNSPEEEDHTITPERPGPFLSRATTSPPSIPAPLPKPLVRTRTTPNRAYFENTRGPNGAGQESRSRLYPVGKNPQDGEIRKMKSAGDLRRAKNHVNGMSPNAQESELPVPSPRPGLVHYPTSLSSSNLLNMNTNAAAGSGTSSPSVMGNGMEYPKRFASLGPNSHLPTSQAQAHPHARPQGASSTSRPQLSQSMWTPPTPPAMTEPTRASSYTAATSSVAPPRVQKAESHDGVSGAPSANTSRRRASREKDKDKEKTSRWGFLKKMSMGKIKAEAASPPNGSPAGSPNPPRVARPHTSAGSSGAGGGYLERVSESPTPQIDLRLSTTGMLDSMPVLTGARSPSPSPNVSLSPRMQLNSEAMPPALSLQVTQLKKSPTSTGQSLFPPSPMSPNGLLSPTSLASPRTTKRRSFLPLDAPGMMAVTIPESAPFVPGVVVAGDGDLSPSMLEGCAAFSGNANGGPLTPIASPSPGPYAYAQVQAQAQSQAEYEAEREAYIRREAERAREAYMRALRSVMAYLKDMNDLGVTQQAGRAGARLIPPTGATPSGGANALSMYEARRGSEGDDGSAVNGVVNGAGSEGGEGSAGGARQRRPTVGEVAALSREPSMTSTATMVETAAHLRLSDAQSRGVRSGTSSQTLSVATTDSSGSGSGEERKFKDDKTKRANLVREIVATERTYVNGLQELVDIYIKPAATPANLLSGVGSSSKETVVPASERRVVFGGIDALFSFHQQNFLPALEGAAAPLMRPQAELLEADHDGQLSLEVAKAVGNIFVKHAAFMKMYSSYINNFDSSVQRVKYWTSDRNAPQPAQLAPALTPSTSSSQLVGLGISMALASTPNAIPDASAAATGIPNLTTSQRRRIKTYLKRCRLNPRHTQLNLEGYLLLPVQRVPRYKLLLEELLRSTPPTYGYVDDPLERALAEIALLANNMNEGKRDSESRRKLVQWQTRIRGKFPSPLVQPHRRLIMDGPLLLTRVVRKAVMSFEAINAQGDASTVQVDCLAPELTPRPLIGILCNDLLVLCRDSSEGTDPTAPVDLWAVLRMQTLPQPASIVHGNALRLVDNKAILYFDAPTPSAALNWYRAINLHIPASKT